MRPSLLLLGFFIFLTTVQAVEPLTHILENGMKVVSLAGGASPLITVELLIDCSALDEPYQYQGVRQVLLGGMMQGSTKRSGQRIFSEIAEAGGTLQGRVRQDYIEISATFPSASFPLVISAMAELVCRPQLTEDGIEAFIEQMKRDTTVRPLSSVELAEEFAQRLLFAEHPYGNNGKGTPQSLENITPEIARIAYQLFIRPDKTVIAITGQGFSQNLLDDIQAVFGNWERGERYPERRSATPPSLTASRLFVREEPVQNTCILLMFPVCGANNDDFLAVQLIDALLCGGTGSRLFRDIREQRHLAYDVATRLPIQLNSSYFSVYAVTSGRKLEETKSAIVAQLERLQTETVDAVELARARAYLKGRILMGRQSTAETAFELAKFLLEGKQVTKFNMRSSLVDQVTAEDVKRVALRYFTHYYLVVVLPQTVDPLTKAIAGLPAVISRVQHD